MATYIEERPDGKLVEYRRRYDRPGILDLEGRILRRDGTPYDDCWYTVTDGELLRLQRATDIVELLADQPEEVA